MGHRCTTDTVPFVAHNVLYVRGTFPDNDLAKVLELSVSTPYEDSYDEKMLIRGWAFKMPESTEADNDDPDCDYKVGNKRRLYIEGWLVKGEHRIFGLNESQYSNVEVWEVAICANDKTSLDVFIKDFEDCFNEKPVVEELDAVQQWL